MIWWNRSAHSAWQCLWNTSSAINNYGMFLEWFGYDSGMILGCVGDAGPFGDDWLHSYTCKGGGLPSMPGSHNSCSTIILIPESYKTERKKSPNGTPHWLHFHKQFRLEFGNSFEIRSFWPKRSVVFARSRPAPDNEQQHVAQHTCDHAAFGVRRCRENLFRWPDRDDTWPLWNSQTDPGSERCGQRQAKQRET